MQKHTLLLKEVLKIADDTESTIQSISKTELDQQQKWTYERTMQFVEDDVMVRMKCESYGY